MYRTIVVGTDCSPTAERAVATAAELAELTGAKLHLVTVYHDAAASLAVASGAGMVASEWPELAIREQGARVDTIVEGLRARGIDVEGRVEHGTPAVTLVTVADAVGADLLVVGDRGLKGLRGVLGSVPNRVTHRAPIDVLVVHTT